MNKTVKIIIIGLFIIVFSIAPFILPADHEIHSLLMGLHVLFIILISLWFSRYIFISTGCVIILHITSDALALQAFPIGALINSLLLIVIALNLYFIVQKANFDAIRMKNVIEATRVGVWSWNIKTGQTTYDERWAEILGYKLAELLPTTDNTWRELTHPDDIKISDDAIEKIFKKEAAYYEVTIRMRHKDGHYVWINDRGKVIKWNKLGEPLLAIGTHNNVTKEKTLEDERLQALNLMGYTIDHAHGGIAVFDKNLKFIYVSQKYLNQFKITAENVIGKHQDEIFPNMPPKWRIVHERALRGEILSANTDLYIKDNEKFWSRWECRPWYENSGIVGGIIIYSEVINDIMNTYHALRDSQKRLQAIMDHSPIGFAVASLSNDFTINYMNDNFSKILDTPASELEKPGNFWNAIFKKPIAGQDMKKRILGDLKLGGDLPFSWLNLPIEKIDEKTKYISIYASIFGKDQTVVITIIDVTEQNSFQQELDYRAKYDAFTDIFNREHFAKRLMVMDVSDNYPLGLILIDIDSLKLINDAFGFEVGNKAILELVQILKKEIKGMNIIGRLGGDEFAIALPRTSFTILDDITTKISKEAAKIKAGEANLSITISNALKENNETTTLELLKKVEDNMYKRKLITRKSSRNHAIEAIFKALTLKYEEEKIHSSKVSEYCRGIGKILKMRAIDIEALATAGLYHDIGKITLPDIILHKPIQLTKQEYDIVKTHSKTGYDILREADLYSSFAVDVLYHHEHYDGKGYPQGLKGDEIPLNARIIAVADAYEAMTSDRPYRKALNKQIAISELTKNKGSQFDPLIVDAFLSYLN